MPTALPSRRRRAQPTLFFLWAVALFAAGIAVEWIDPAPMDVAAAWVVSP